MAVQPRLHRFTVDEYQLMGTSGLFHEDDRVELLEGEIFEMSPIGVRHAACVARLTRVFGRLGPAALLWVQNPVRLGDLSEPQPDLALLRPRADDYSSAHPGPEDVLLVVEVADSSVGWDRSRKVPLYLQAGVAEVWLVDLTAEVIEVSRRAPGQAEAVTHHAAAGDTLRPLAFPDLSLDVADLLP